SGNDGSWGTFNVGVGTPLQQVELLPSTLVPESWVVLEEGCTDDDPSNCTVTRGGVYKYNDSSSWTRKDNYALTAESNLGFTGNSENGAYGWENLALATTDGSNITMNETVIAGIATKSFYLGVLGLATRAVEWRDSDESVPSLLTSLESQNLIPSLSYGYTAGHSYNNAPPSLTLGGHDTSRFTPNDVTFAITSQVLRQLVVNVQSISVTNSKGSDELVATAFPALIDSTVAQMWLPIPICEAFEDAFDIDYDPISGLYTITDEQHDALVEQAAEVTFQLGTSSAGGPTVSITLPYASFDLEASPPLTMRRRRYFPLRQARDDGQYTLGRTFLQEAFIIVDYNQENPEFSVSQAVYDEGTPSHIVVTNAASSSDAPTENGNSEDPAGVTRTSSDSSGGIGTGAIAGIAVGIAAIVVAIIGFCLWRFKFRKSRRNKEIVKGKSELEGDSEPKGVHEAFNKRPLPDDGLHEKEKHAAIGVNEIDRTPPAELDSSGRFGGSANAGTSFDNHGGRAELPSPDPFRPELESPENIRSELSTPEPRSELSSADPSLVPELTSREIPHEMSSNRNSNSRRRPVAYRHDSIDSDIVSPHDSASINGRQTSGDTLTTPISPQPKRPAMRYSQRRHSGQRPQHIRLNSSSSHDTFETRFNGPSTPLQHPQSPSPLASPPIGVQDSPALSGLNSPSFAQTKFQDPGPPTPNLDITENQPLMNQQQPYRGRFSENLTADPESMTREERPPRDRSMVRDEVDKLEARTKSDQMPGHGTSF
ncbi:MAG: hypothetical protein Q9174_005344, partial [Haloplaca sp. 1 TL-2023]